MLHTPTSGTFDFSAGMSAPKVTIDEDEADLTVLEENLKSTDEFCTEIVRQLETIATENTDAIRTMRPLMSKIKVLSRQQKNISATSGLVNEVKGVAGKVKDLDKEAAKNEEMKSTAQIDRYCGVLTKYEAVRTELAQKNLDGFSGLTKGLDGSIRNADVTLKYVMIAKLKSLSGAQLERTRSKELEDRYIEQISHIYTYMKEKRGNDLLENVVRERVTHDTRILTSGRRLRLPEPAKEQNYLYNGPGPNSNSLSFVEYCGIMRRIFQDEAGLMTQMLTSPQDAAATLALICEKLFAELDIQTTTFVGFVAKNNFTHCTVLYELEAGLRSVLQAVSQFGVHPPDALVKREQSVAQKACEVFQGFFEFVNQRYHEMVVPERPNETLNNTFMMIVTRLSKFAAFRDQQLQCVAQLRGGEWLPAYKPRGFVPVNVEGGEPALKLSVFYSDVIEFSFYNLVEKFHGKMMEEDLGIMLLFNLDGLQNLLDSRSQLKGILGTHGMGRVDRLKKKAIDRATADWGEMIQRLMMAGTKQGDAFNMSNKEMAKFIDEFTRDFDENWRRLRTKNLPPFFKKELARNITNILAPAYNVFYSSVTSSGSKSVVKHFRFNPSEFQNKLMSLA